MGLSPTFKKKDCDSQRFGIFGQTHSDANKENIQVRACMHFGLTSESGLAYWDFLFLIIVFPLSSLCSNLMALCLRSRRSPCRVLVSAPAPTKTLLLSDPTLLLHLWYDLLRNGLSSRFPSVCNLHYSCSFGLTTSNTDTKLSPISPMQLSPPSTNHFASLDDSSPLFLRRSSLTSSLHDDDDDGFLDVLDDMEVCVCVCKCC